MKRFSVDLDESLEEGEQPVRMRVEVIPPAAQSSPIYIDLTSPEAPRSSSEVIDLCSTKVIISPIIYNTPRNRPRPLPIPRSLFHTPDPTRLLNADDWMCVQALLELEKSC